MDKKQQANEFGEIVRKSGETIKKEMEQRGLERDNQLSERVKRIQKECIETHEYIKKRTSEK